MGETEPINVKSSNLTVPRESVAPVKLIWTVIVPVKFCTGFKTPVFPRSLPLPGIDPEPTEIPFMVIDQFVGPVALLSLQKLNWVIESWYSCWTSKVIVIMGFPVAFLKPIASPEEPVKPVHWPVEFDQIELEKCESNIGGGSV